LSIWSELDEILGFPGEGQEGATAPEAHPVDPTPERVRVPDDLRRARERFVRKTVRSSGVVRRRGFPIIGYIGDNGSGKTLTAVRDTLPSLIMGRTVVSTTPLFDPLAEYDKTPHASYRPLRSWTEITTLRNADLLLDEVQSVANSRQANAIPPQLLTAFLQLRKRGVVLRWTTTHWARIDLSLREVTKAAVICNSSWPQRKAGADGWRPKRRFSARLVDAASLDGAYTIQLGDESPERGVRTMARERYWRRDSWPRLYDSDALVEVLDHVDAAGWCMTCGGTRQRQRCTCGQVHK